MHEVHKLEAQFTTHNTRLVQKYAIYCFEDVYTQYLQETQCKQYTEYSHRIQTIKCNKHNTHNTS